MGRLLGSAEADFAPGGSFERNGGQRGCVCQWHILGSANAGRTPGSDFERDAGRTANLCTE
jgi:hypothetical protein